MLIKLCLEVLNELPGLGLFFALFPFSLADRLNETLSHSIEYSGVLHVGLYEDGGRPWGHGGDGRFVGDGGAREGGHVSRAVGVVPGTGVVFTEVRVDEGVGLRELV